MLTALIILGLAAWRVTYFILYDRLPEQLRERVWTKYPPETTKIGYLFTCPYCMGFWVSLLLVVLYFLLPTFTLFLALVGALSAIVVIIQHALDR